MASGGAVVGSTDGTGIEAIPDSLIDTKYIDT
jgi:hypothetical protein